MKKSYLIILATLTAILIFSGAYYFLSKENSQVSIVDVENKPALKLFYDDAFSFNYPDSFNHTDLIETLEGGEEIRNIIFRGKSERETFQLIVSGFDSEPVTIARLQVDLPELSADNPQEISVEGARGVVFTTTDSESGITTREIWFSQSDKLYQISTYPEFDGEMEEILLTWRWTE